MRVVSQDELPFSRIARTLAGEDHGGLDVSLIFVEAPPGEGPSLHTHPYAEVFIVEEGEASFVAGDEERTVRSGDIVIVPAGTPHRFVNSGATTLRQVTIHLSSRFVTEWLV
jgi:mannose-6-phosphate isomerase-like protein (cupin superfamily)